MKTKLLAVPLFLIIFFSGYSQPTTPSVVNAAGSSASNGSFSIDWSIGEPALINTMEAPNGKFVITNGFLQADKWDKNKSLLLFTKEEVTVLPNPTKGKMEVWINSSQKGALTIALHDAAGREIYKKKVENYGSLLVEKFDLTSKPSGTYVLNISLSLLSGSDTKRGAYPIIKM